MPLQNASQRFIHRIVVTLRRPNYANTITTRIICGPNDYYTSHSAATVYIRTNNNTIECALLTLCVICSFTKQFYVSLSPKPCNIYFLHFFFVLLFCWTRCVEENVKRKTIFFGMKVSVFIFLTITMMRDRFENKVNETNGATSRKIKHSKPDRWWAEWNRMHITHSDEQCVYRIARKQQQQKQPTNGLWKTRPATSRNRNE